ncbi:MAG: DUF4349 domain-containing protein [Planctomycetes bacterium]|nr:DUF4349 domain-containing protein [Planctomycetota bacterium]
MRMSGTFAMLAGGLLLLIFTAGFFHAGSESPKACRNSEAAGCPAPGAEAPELRNQDLFKAPAGARGLLAMTQSPGYKRAGDLSLRVADCTKAEDDLESKLTAIKGEIIDMLMEGTEGSRSCTLSAVIPADQFRSFITDLRKMGKVQSERITASKLRPGQADRTAAAEGADPRELSLVSIRMADEKVAQTVLESRGVLASSFDRSASHFMKGLAVIVELVGLALPFGLAFIGLSLPVLLALRLRRSRTVSV